MTTTTVTINITPDQILEHRRVRKDSGMAGCLTGRQTPQIDFFGFRDVQIWNYDASGRLNGDPEFNRKDPGCLCFDCRGTFDPKGEIDAEIVNEGHQRARWTYGSLLPLEARVSNPDEQPTAEPSGLSNESPPSLREPVVTLIMRS